MTTITIPTPLRTFTGGQAAIAVDGGTVGEALHNLVGLFPALQPHLYDADGRLRSFVNIYLGDEDIRFLDREATVIAGDATVSIVPSIAGGGA